MVCLGASHNPNSDIGWATGLWGLVSAAGWISVMAAPTVGRWVSAVDGRPQFHLLGGSSPLGCLGVLTTQGKQLAFPTANDQGAVLFTTQPWDARTHARTHALAILD